MVSALRQTIAKASVWRHFFELRFLVHSVECYVSVLVPIERRDTGGLALINDTQDSGRVIGPCLRPASIGASRVLVGVAFSLSFYAFHSQIPGLSSNDMVSTRPSFVHFRAMQIRATSASYGPRTCPHVSQGQWPNRHNRTTTSSTMSTTMSLSSATSSACITPGAVLLTSTSTLPRHADFCLTLADTWCLSTMARPMVCIWSCTAVSRNDIGRWTLKSPTTAVLLLKSRCASWTCKTCCSRLDPGRAGHLLPVHSCHPPPLQCPLITRRPSPASRWCHICMSWPCQCACGP